MLSPDGVRRVVGRRRSLGDLRPVHGRYRDGRDGKFFGLAGDDDLRKVQRRARQLQAGAAGGWQQARGVQLYSVIVSRGRSRNCIIIWRLLLHRFIVRHRNYVNRIVDLKNTNALLEHRIMHTYDGR